MIGHQQIIALRANERRPRMVFVVVGPHPEIRWPWQHPEGELADGALPEVWTGDTDPGSADLRWLHGLRVHIEPRGCSQERFWRWYDAVRAAGPRAIFGIEPDGELLAWQA